MSSENIFIGTDNGGTTCKTAAVWESGKAVTTKLLQRSTNSANGRDAVVVSWITSITEFLAENNLSWQQVRGVGLAIPGPYESYGVLGKSANLHASFAGWNVHADYSRALSKVAGYEVSLIVGNDGKCGGVAEAQLARGNSSASVLMLMPGSGLGSAFIAGDGLPLEGDTLSGMETAHMPAPLHLLGVRPFPCGCGRTWGCIEAYTTLSGLPLLLEEMLPRHPDHDLARSPLGPRERAMALRGLAQKEDPLA